MRPGDTHQPRKRFGQNFLEDRGVLQSIAHAISPAAEQHLVEIGPGLGALTAELIDDCGHLTLIELDRELIPRLQSRFAPFHNWNLIQADALTIDYSQLTPTPIRVVGNLPYNISTPLIFHLIKHAACIENMHFMLQREVVERLTAEPDSGHWGRLAIMVQYHCETEWLLDVPPEAFNPAPKVESAVLRITPRPPLLEAISLKRFEEVVKQAFSQRRKTLRNTLKNLFNDDDLLGLDIDPGARAQELSLSQYVELSNLLEK